MLTPLLIALQSELNHLKNHQQKKVSHTARKRSGLCTAVPMGGDAETPRYREKCFLPQGNDLNGSLLQKGQGM